MVSGSHEDAHGAISRDVQAQAGAKTVDPVAGKTVAEILGEIVWLMTQDPAGREMKVAEIEALVMPAILAKRFHIKYTQVPDMRRPGGTTLQPISVDVFALPGFDSGKLGKGTIIAAFKLNGAHGE